MNHRSVGETKILPLFHILNSTQNLHGNVYPRRPQRLLIPSNHGHHRLGLQPPRFIRLLNHVPHARHAVTHRRRAHRHVRFRQHLPHRRPVPRVRMIIIRINITTVVHFSKISVAFQQTTGAVDTGGTRRGTMRNPTVRIVTRQTPIPSHRRRRRRRPSSSSSRRHGPVPLQIVKKSHATVASVQHGVPFGGHWDAFQFVNAVIGYDATRGVSYHDAEVLAQAFRAVNINGGGGTTVAILTHEAE
mmetsp:Transcript_39582/g.48187  ORF Transcript_39582/g.48187 Transcript_39582/m.48187 type:complete len:245 (+) Transcript_39582:693-1427(+)